MAYIKKTWKDYPDTTTPILAEDLNNIEDVLETVTKYITATVQTGQPGKCYITAPGTLASGDTFNVMFPTAVNPSANAQFSVDGGTTYYNIYYSGVQILVRDIQNKNLSLYYDGNQFTILTKINNYAIATISTDFTITSSSNQIIPLDLIRVSGNLLTLNSNGIKINGNVKKIKVSAYMFFENFETSRVLYMWPKIFKNTTNMIGAIKAGSLLYDVGQVPAIEIEVTTNDVIKLIVDPSYVSGQSGTFLRSDFRNLGLIVEVVE